MQWAEEGYTSAKCTETLHDYEDRDDRERQSASRADRPELASTHRLLTIQYEGDVHELRREIGVKA